jgi:hypothetical protein
MPFLTCPKKLMRVDNFAIKQTVRDTVQKYYYNILYERHFIDRLKKKKKTLALSILLFEK